MIITQEHLFEHNVKLAIKKFKEDMESKSTGEELQDEIWENKELFGEIMFEVIIDSLGEEVFD